MQTQYSQTGMFLGDRDEHLQKKAKKIKINNHHDFMYPEEHVVLFVSLKVCCTPYMFPQ